VLKKLNFILLFVSAISYSQEPGIRSIAADTSRYPIIRLYIKDRTSFIKSSPNNPEHYFKRGEYYVALSDLKSALADFTKAIELTKGTKASAGPYYKRGSVYDRMGDYPNAILDFSVVISLMPDWEWGYNDRGMMYIEIGQLDKAEADFKKAISLKPEWSLAYTNLAMLYEKKLNIPKAIETYQKAIALDAANSLAHNNLGYIYFTEKEYDKAIAEYTLAIENTKNYTNAYRNRADAKLAKGDSNGACEDVHKAAAMGDPKAIAYAAKFCKE
jgi:tetratricopeptide (TPR) repeat protein